MSLPLVLTRPAAQSRAVAAALPGVPVLISPVLEIVPTGLHPDLTAVRGVILTSAQGAELAPDLSGIQVFCVGARTAEIARLRGAQVAGVAPDAEALLAMVRAAGPLLHLRGEHARGDLAKRLTLAGIDTDEQVIYRQIELPLTAECKAMIEADAPVVLPLYSPRSAALVAGQLVRVGAGVKAIAMSEAVARAWPGSAEICTQPTGAEMLARMRAACGLTPP